MSTEGINIEITKYVDQIIDDRAGPRISTDEQRFGTEARISGDFVWYDESVRQQLFAWADNGTTSNEGTMGYAGVLFGLGGFYYNLVLQGPAGSQAASPTNETLWNFHNARLEPNESVRLGTVKNVWHMVWKAVNYLGSATSLNTSVLYTHVFP